MAEPQLPPQVQQQLETLQKLQNQLAIVQQQRQQIELQVREAERAIEELGQVSDDAPVYRTVGGILFQTAGKADAITRISDEKESLEVRLNGFRKQEGRTKEEAQELQSKVQAALANLPAFSGLPDGSLSG